MSMYRLYLDASGRTSLQVLDHKNDNNWLNVPTFVEPQLTAPLCAPLVLPAGWKIVRGTHDFIEITAPDGDSATVWPTAQKDSIRLLHRLAEALL
jgi:hypothetical protein